MINLTFDEWKDRVAANSALGLVEAAPVNWGMKTPRLCIVATGPSLRSHIGNLRRQRREGALVMALNRAYPFLVDKVGLIPHYAVVMDPGDMLDAIEPRNQGTLHLLASQVRPEVFDALAGTKVAIWHAHNEGWDKWPDHPARRIMVEGATVGINALYLAAMLGHYDIHLFGFDGYHRDGKRHFQHQANDENFHGAEIEVGGRKYLTDYHLAWQAAQLSQLKRLHGGKFNLTFHGSGLLSAVWKEAA
jgi:hypothetical protein